MFEESSVQSDRSEWPVVAVLGSDEVLQDSLWSALSELYRVRIVASTNEAPSTWNAVVCVGCSPSQAVNVARPGIPCLVFVGGEEQRFETRRRLEFSPESCPIPAFRGASLVDNSLDRFHDFPSYPGDEVIATLGDTPVWVRRSHNGTDLHLVKVDPPALGKSGFLFEHFERDKWFRLLPLLHTIQLASRWDFGPNRACVMFDDPNLHWPTYGYVNFDEIARDAERHDYHCAFATIPLDSWFVSPRAAGVFRRPESRLSLLMHGNDHTHLELCRPTGDQDGVALALHALRRMSRLEQMAGVPVDRIIAAPHGACSDRMAKNLLRTGFEAACISRGSIMARNPDLMFPASVGLAPAEFLGGGLPIVPRFGLHPDTELTTRMALFLGQPAIAVGHHGDLRSGLDPLQQFSSVCNAIGAVLWSRLMSISRRNYWTRSQKTSLRVRMFARNITMELPPAAVSLIIERPWIRPGEVERMAVRDVDRSEQAGVTYGGPTLRVSLPPGPTVTLESTPPQLDFEQHPYRRTSVAAILRRQACEVRDRMRPLLDRVSGRSAPDMARLCPGGHS